MKEPNQRYYCGECAPIVAAEKVREQSRRNYARHKVRHRATAKAWAQANRELTRLYARRGQLVRRARKVGAFVEDICPAVVYEMHGGRCGVCGEFIAGAFHVDHVVPLARGGLHGYVNVQPAHPVCNMRKGVSVSP
jgi:5-methylcytosine-specific restriction endonuclease McrA